MAPSLPPISFGQLHVPANSCKFSATRNSYEIINVLVLLCVAQSDSESELVSAAVAVAMAEARSSDKCFLRQGISPAASATACNKNKKHHTNANLIVVRRIPVAASQHQHTPNPNPSPSHILILAINAQKYISGVRCPESANECFQRGTQFKWAGSPGAWSRDKRGVCHKRKRIHLNFFKCFFCASVPVSANGSSFFKIYLNQLFPAPPSIFLPFS